MLSALLHPEPLLLCSEASHIPTHHLLILNLPFVLPLQVASTIVQITACGLTDSHRTFLLKRSLWDHVPCRLPCLELGWHRCGPFSVPGFSLSRMEPVTGTAKARTNDLNYFIEALARIFADTSNSTKDTALVHARRRRRMIDYKSRKTKPVQLPTHINHIVRKLFH